MGFGDSLGTIRGSSVRSYTLAAKKRLKALGYNEIENAGNGIFGKGTTEAVKAFQRVNGIEATADLPFIG